MDYDDLPSREPIYHPRKSRNRKRTHGKVVKSSPVHKASGIETRVSQHLSNNGIHHIMEKTWPALTSLLYPDQLLPVDFYLPRHGCVIELDGEHHYKMVVGDKDADALERRRLNDRTRELFLMQRGVRLLRIKYTDFKDYRAIINSFLDIKSS